MGLEKAKKMLARTCPRLYIYLYFSCPLGVLMAKREERRFSAGKLALVSQAVEVAEDRVSNHFHLSENWWLRCPFEVRTRAELRSLEVAPHALAQVLRLRRPPRPGSLRGRDFYRICLQDANLLGAAQREGSGGYLLPLLIYVLTHELVHVVRFYRFQHLFEGFPGQRELEEATVHDLTARMLARVKVPHLDRVLEKYNRAEGPAWCPPIMEPGMARGEEYAYL